MEKRVSSVDRVAMTKNKRKLARASAENFSGGRAIKIEPVLTLKMENFLKFARFKIGCVKIQRGDHSPGRKFFRGWPIRIEPVLKLKMEEFLKFGRFKIR